MPNEAHDWRIYSDFAQILIGIARPMYAQESLGFDLDSTVYALDSTTIDLCLAMFPWARFRSRKGAVKMHTLLDLRGSIPTFIEVTEGQVHDVNILDDIVPEAGSFCDGSRLRRLPAVARIPVGCGVLCGAHQDRCSLAPPLLSSRGPSQRRAVRPHRCPDHRRIGQTLSGCAA